MTAAKTGASLMKKATGRQQEYRARTRGHQQMDGETNTGCRNPKLNQLWSIWYCVMTLAFQIYIVTKSIQRFMRYISLPWPTSDQPYLELNAYVGLVGTAVVILPFFLVSSLLRVGNYSNDGLKIGSDQDPDNAAVRNNEAGVAGDPAAVYQNLSGARGSARCLRWFKSVWRHGGPTAPVLHMAAAFCLLIPTVLIQAQLIRHGFLSKADIWKTDLDFFVPHRDRLVMLKFLSTVNTSEAIQREEIDRARPRLHLDPTSATERQYVTDELAPGLVSAEFLNYAIALLVHAVRYPSVFWRTNKAFGLVFSLQLVIDAAQKIVTFAGFTVLYKIHVYGPHDVLLRHNPLLLNVPVTLILFLIYNLVLTFSGSVLYLYGLQKYREWRESTVKKTHVTWKEESRRLWGHVPHLGAFMVVLMVALTASPLMYDYTMVYCGSLDGAMLAGVTGTITHLFLWILLWLALTIKHRWQFKRQGMDANGGINNTVNPIRGGPKNGKDTPLLVIDNGQTYQVREKTSKKAIVSLAQRSAAASPAPSVTKQISPASADDEDIYWLKPKASLPSKDAKESTESERLAWLKTHKKSPGIRHKVSFEEKSGVNGNTCKRTRSSASAKSPKVTVKNKKGVKFEDLSDDNSDDGDYATLREMVVARDETDDETIDQPLFKNGTDPRQHRRILSADGDYELLVDENYKLTAPVVVHSGGVPLRPMHKTGGQNVLLGDGYEPLSTMGINQGSSEGHLTPKSDSASETSTTSPEKGGGCGSESSSGVHSNSSVQGDPKRSSSMENLLQDLVQARPTPWKSMSLQRNTPAPMPLLNITTGTNTTPRSIKPDAIYFDPNDSTLVIRRKQKRDNGDGAPAPIVAPAIVPLTTSGVSDHFGRATNMRMTSFTDQPDFPNGNTLQHLQSGGHLSGLGVLPGPGTPKPMPSLPSSPKMVVGGCNNDGNQNSMGNYGTLSLTAQVKNFPALLGNGIYGTTKPLGAVGQSTLLPMYPVHQRRDSANYSLTSSGDSDTYISHT